MSVSSKIEDFCIELNSNKRNSVDDLLPVYFGDISQNELLVEMLTFSERNVGFTKILRPVMDKLKPKIYSVYLLEKNNLVVYVGKSTDVCARLNVHAKEKDFDKVYVIDLLNAESQSLCENSLILKYLPKYNKNINISDVTVNTEFEASKVELKYWLERAAWFTMPNNHLKDKIGYSISPKGFIVYAGLLDLLYFPTKDSIVVVEHRGVAKDENKKVIGIYQQLKNSVDIASKPELLSIVTAGVYKLGKYYITDNGRWRVEGSQKWYMNVNVNMLTKEVMAELVSEVSVSTKTVPLWFGKYKGKTYAEVCEIDAQYCDWLKSKLSKVELNKIGA